MSSEKYYSQSQDSQPLARQHDKNLVLVHEVYANGDRYDGFAAPTLDLQQRPSGTISPRMVKEGQGTYVFANGSSYVGEWSRGQMNGWGTFTDGGTLDRFEGAWRSGQRCWGVYYYHNGDGDLYQGAFDAESGALKHGRGVVWEEHVMYEVVYDHDKLISKKPFDFSPNGSVESADKKHLQSNLLPCSDETRRQQPKESSVAYGSSTDKRAAAHHEGKRCEVPTEKTDSAQSLERLLLEGRMSGGKTTAEHVAAAIKYHKEKYREKVSRLHAHRQQSKKDVPKKMAIQEKAGIPANGQQEESIRRVTLLNGETDLRHVDTGGLRDAYRYYIS